MRVNVLPTFLSGSEFLDLTKYYSNDACENDFLVFSQSNQPKTS